MKNVVFITAIRNPNRPDRAAMYDLSIDSWRRWCDANGCDLFVLDEPIVDLDVMSPIFFRHYCFDLLGDYEYGQICTVDADTIVHPECPNFFLLTLGRFSGVHNDGDYDWIIRSIENYQYEFPSDFKQPFDIWKYINSGFMVTSKEYKFVHDALLKFYWDNEDKVRSVQKKYGTGTDQPLINLITNELQVDIHLLPYQFNMQDLQRKNALQNILFTQIPGVYHFNAVEGGPTEVNRLMQTTHNYLFT